MNRQKLQQAIKNNSNFTPSRKTSLYSNFSRLENANPEGYEANIAAWKQVIEDSLQLGAFEDRTLISAGPELTNNLLDPENGRPISLDSVLNEMVSAHELVPLDEFERQFNPGYISNALRFVWGKFWGPGKFESSEGGVLKTVKYVDLNALKTASSQLITELKRLSLAGTTVFDIDELEFNGFSKLDLKLCLLTSPDVFFNQSLNLAKLKTYGQITEQDQNIVLMQRQIAIMGVRDLDLSEQITEHTAKAKECLARGDRHGAKVCLQKRNAAEKSRQHILNAINQLETILHKVEEAKTNKQTMEVLNLSSNILKHVNAGVSIEDVDALVEQINEEISTTDEVTQQIAGLSIDDVEVDNELEQMLDEELDAKLPSAPKTKLNGSTEKFNKDKVGYNESVEEKENIAA